MPKYNVTVYYRGMYEAEIEADNEKRSGNVWRRRCKQ